MYLYLLAHITIFKKKLYLIKAPNAWLQRTVGPSRNRAAVRQATVRGTSRSVLMNKLDALSSPQKNDLFRVCKCGVILGTFFLQHVKETIYKHWISSVQRCTCVKTLSSHCFHQVDLWGKCSELLKLASWMNTLPAPTHLMCKTL